MPRKSNAILTVRVNGNSSSEDETESLTLAYRDGGGESTATLLESSYGDSSPPCGSTSNSPPLSPSGEERRPLRVDFADIDYGNSDMEKSQRKKDIEKDLKKFSRRGTGSVRYAEPRMSLLGKPLNYRMHRKDARVRKIQARIYNFLERPKIWPSVIYHILMFLVIVGCLVLSVLATVEDFHPKLFTRIALYLEPVLLVWLMVEYAIRVWAAGCRSRYQGCSGRLRFMRRPLCIIDMVIIGASIVVLSLGIASPMFAASPLRGLRFFQILRMARMDRRGGSWKLLGSVVWAHRQELLTTLYIGFLGLLFSSFLVYLAEKDADKKKFRSFADALWWGVITLCTVGYGDVVPTTWAGKLIAAFSAVLGISFFALPAGILGSGFALKVQQQQRQKHLIRRRVPAARLIQCLWRCYAADENSMSIATWKPHMIPCPSPTSDRQWKNNTGSSFVSRFSTRRRDRSSAGSSITSNSPHSPLIPRKESKRPNGTADTDDFAINRSHLSLATGLADQRVDQLPIKKDNPSPSFSYRDQNEEEDHSPKMTQLTEQHKKAIRAIRKIRYFVSKKKFREALRPYDVKDVIEQYSAGHVDMLGRIKSLQSRLDQILGKVGSKKKDTYDSKQSLASRIVKVERSTEDIESKLDLLFDMYKEDRKILLQYCQSKSQITNNLPASGEATPVASCLKSSTSSLKQPRSILADKQCSEPSTPTSLGNIENPSMQRNLSDLSQRIKKRVTYRLLSLNVEAKEKQEPSSIPYKGRRKSASFDTGDELIVQGHRQRFNTRGKHDLEEVFREVSTETNNESPEKESGESQCCDELPKANNPLTQSQRREQFLRGRVSRDSSNKSYDRDRVVRENESFTRVVIDTDVSESSTNNSPIHLCYASDSGTYRDKIDK
ncbi:potassium voltage-gated channel subfamily KQT member 1-like isoform X2 [Mizuhopecten yessoensis]|uniref:potassium voltage-gated channel subfamily KQT member 1-like isoform X2 n=1 Tax=Mizuhopecten yessoensis TaxID=6573 RepID=UPI000B45A4F7|nr:potassium voltage-gated channel subfamily KQT member 1-like isoform X2 [Mizuhopecten yessoensis]